MYKGSRTCYYSAYAAWPGCCDSISLYCIIAIQMNLRKVLNSYVLHGAARFVTRAAAKATLRVELCSSDVWPDTQITNNNMLLVFEDFSSKNCIFLKLILFSIFNGLLKYKNYSSQSTVWVCWLVVFNCCSGSYYYYYYYLIINELRNTTNKYTNCNVRVKLTCV